MRLSLGQKLMGIFAAIAGLSILSAVLTFRGTNEMISSSEWVNHTYQVLQQVALIQSTLTDAETGQRGFLITGEDRYLKPFEDARSRIEQAIKTFRDLTLDNPHQTERANRIAELATKKLNEMEDTISQRRSNGFETAKKLVLTDQGKAVMDEIRTLMMSAKSEEEGLLIKRDNENRMYATNTKSALLIGMALSIFLFLLTFFYVQRGIVIPLGHVVKMAAGIAAGNLKQPQLVVNSHDEIGDLATVFNGMILSLKDLASQNISVAKNLGTAASQVLSSIQEQAAAVKQQVTSLQETTATMEEISQSGAQVSEKARQVSTVVESASSASNSGIAAVQNANQTVMRIRSQVESVAENIVNLSERNQTIGEIITTVNDIAEQSNLLALNAAIEAAAAGDSGQRFSVVASEIKSLAEQAKTATSQVRSILSDIQKGINSSVMLTEEAVKRAETGKQHADIAEQTIQQLSSTTQESMRTFQQIMGATNQQQIGFDQITQALKGIRVGAEQTAASTSQLEKAAVSMNALGLQLQKSVERYQI